MSEGQGPSCCGAIAQGQDDHALDALKIYALKTAPAFEAALVTGVRLAGPAEPMREADQPVSREHLGVAFQILNDLKDWEGDDDNKLVAGGDVLGGRPTVLWALALEALNEEDRRQLESLLAQPAERIHDRAVRRLYEIGRGFRKGLAAGGKISRARRSRGRRSSSPTNCALLLSHLGGDGPEGRAADPSADTSGFGPTELNRQKGASCAAPGFPRPPRWWVVRLPAAGRRLPP